MKNIVIKENGEAKVSIRDIASYSGYDVVGVRNLINRHNDRLKIEMPKGSHKILSGLNLTERQATHLIIFMKNTPSVLDFKDSLISQFFAMREIITNELCAVHEKKEHDFEQKVFTLELKLQDASELRTYKEGRMSLRKYLKNRGLKKDIREEDAWEILVNRNIVQNVIIPTLRRGLIDSEYGLQTDIRKSPVFNPEKLDEIFLSDQMVFDYEELQDA